MSDIFKYSATISQQNNHSAELAALLPQMIGEKLERVAARGVTIHDSIVSFHGRASRSAPRTKRFITNWNLLQMIDRGSVKTQNNFPEVTVSYWLGFPKTLFYQISVWLVVLGVATGIFYFIVQASIALSLLLAAGIVFGGFLFFVFAFTMGFVMTVARFNLLIRQCINSAEKKLHS